MPTGHQQPDWVCWAHVRVTLRYVSLTPSYHCTAHLVLVLSPQPSHSFVRSPVHSFNNNKPLCNPNTSFSLHPNSLHGHLPPPPHTLQTGTTLNMTHPSILERERPGKLFKPSKRTLGSIPHHLRPGLDLPLSSFAFSCSTPPSSLERPFGSTLGWAWASRWRSLMARIRGNSGSFNYCVLWARLITRAG